MNFIAIILAAVVAFFAGALANAERIQSTCESDDRPLIIRGTEYVCLSPRHIEMLRQRRLQQSWRGVP